MKFYAISSMFGDFFKLFQVQFSRIIKFLRGHETNGVKKPGEKRDTIVLLFFCISTGNGQGQSSGESITTPRPTPPGFFLFFHTRDLRARVKSSEIFRVVAAGESFEPQRIARSERASKREREGEKERKKERVGRGFFCDSGQSSLSSQSGGRFIVDEDEILLVGIGYGSYLKEQHEILPVRNEPVLFYVTLIKSSRNILSSLLSPSNVPQFCFIVYFTDQVLFLRLSAIVHCEKNSKTTKRQNQFSPLHNCFKFRMDTMGKNNYTM